MKRIWGAWLVALMLAACGGDDGGGGGGGGGGGEGGTTEGVGPSTARPKGTPFQLPQGLTVKNPIKGFDETDCYKEDQEDREEKGSGDLVQLCLQFSNTTPNTISVELPPGLIFISFNTETQNGLLVQVETFEVPPGEHSVHLRLFCLNSGRSGADPRDDYELGPVLNEKDPVWVLMNLLKDKAPLDANSTSKIQAALWNITDGDGLTRVDEERIDALP
ncbi:hypothetical protein [Stigmatella erecta]|uniref:Lipoprotein n=1 Tax=Stigmatella erecta TaxID=83460 RepID=A0A1I0KYZ9_9BACT|nr:hypothetical protein [Stigmatella erecta]SEU31759.1 hypothetical protein SAMN05443639_11695 [Stigmatella erecta]